MKKLYALLTGAILTATIQTQAQTKIGGSGAPDSSAMLEVTGGTGNNKGVLLPRISLSNVSTWGLSGSTPVAGMVVYNTNAAVTGGSGAGLYTWEGTQWVKGGNTSGWGLNGNTATNPVTNFLGTTDNQPLILRTGNVERLRIDTLGRIGIADGTPRAPLSLGSAQGQKIRLYDNNTDTLVYGFSISNASLNYIVENTDLAAHRFWSGGSNDNGTELMRIQGNGNVGVATASPQQTLHVQGTARVTGSTGTPSTITGRNATGDIGNVAIGTGLSLAGGTLSATAAPSGWNLAGNAGTTPATNYLGTTDAQPLVLRTNAAERLRIAASGNVGIGNATPISPLSFAPALGTKVAFYDGGIANQYLGIGVSSSQLNYHVGSNSDHVFFAGGTNGDGTELVRIHYDGNVGIGTGAPTAKLDVNGTARIQGSAGTPTAITGRDAAGNVSNITLGANLSLAGGVLSAAAGGTAGWGLNGNTGTNFVTDYIGTADAQPLVMRTNGAEHLRITADGKIGINNGAPVASLDIVGSARISTSLGTPTTITGRDASGNVGNIALGANLSLVGGTLSATGGGTAGWDLTGNAATAGNFIGTTNAQPLVFKANNDEKMRILPNGNVGIGTATPNNHVQIAKADYGQFGGLAVSDIAGANASNFTITPGYYGSVATFGVTLDVTGEAPISFSDPIIPAADGQFSCGTSAYRWSTVYALNGIINTSDARKKKNVRDLGLGLSEIMKLRPVVYDWKDDTGKDKLGFIAQELRKVVPNVVVGDESKETLGVLYSDMIPVLTKAIQEQQKQIEALKAENEKLGKNVFTAQAQIETMKAENATLKESKATTAQLMERIKQMEQMMGIKEIEGTSKVAGK